MESVKLFFARQWARRPTLTVALLLLLLAILFMEQAARPPADMAVGGADVRALFIPWLDKVKAGLGGEGLPFWASDQFAGYPFLSNPQIALFYPPTWLMLLLPTSMGLSWYLILHIWLSGFGMFLLVRYLGGRPLGAFLAALIFSFNGYIAVRVLAGHIGLLATNSWLPWLLLASAWSVRDKRPWAGILAGLPLTLAILAGHTSSLLFLGLAWAAFNLYLIGQGASWWLVGRQLFLAGAVGVALSGVQLLPLAEISRLSSRTTAGYELASGFSLPPAHLLTLLVPEFFGEPTRVGYWSVPNFEELTYYVGILPLLVLLLAWQRPTPLTRFYTLLLVLGLLLALGSYGFLHRLFYDLLPPFRLARAPGRAAYLFVFAIAALSGEALSRWERWEAGEAGQFLAEPLRKGVLAVAALGGAVLAFTAVTFTIQHPSDNSGRLWQHLGSWSLALILLGLAGWGLWRFLSSPVAARPRWGGLLALLILGDLWLFGLKFTQLNSVAVHPMWAEAESLIGDSDLRVLPWGVSIFEQNGAWQAGLDSVFGYNALELATHVALTSRVADPRATAYDILSAGYVVAPAPQDAFTEGEHGLALLGNVGSAWVYQRPHPLPLARLVTVVEVIPDGGVAIERLNEPTFAPATTAILPEDPACTLSGGEPGTATIVDRRPGYWAISTESEGAALLVLSETAYPGWVAQVDGAEVPLYTAYTAIKALCVPAGSHQVTLHYVPTVFRNGALLSVAALLLLVGSAVMLYRKKRAHSD